MKAEWNIQKAIGHVLDKLLTWATDLISMLPNLVVAVIVLVIFYILSLPLGRLAYRTTLKISGHSHIARLVSRFSRLAVVSAGIVLALSALNLDRVVASLLAGVGILGIAIGFASKDIASNFIAGILLHFVHPFRIGDLVQTKEFLGYIEAQEMRSTVMRNQQGQRVILPNELIMSNPIINYTITGVRRVDLTCGVSYGDDLQRAEELAIEVIESLNLRKPDRPVELFYEEFGSSSINFTLRFWTEPDQKTYLKARSQAVKAIKQTFQEHGITIPFPIRTLDFGIVGGENLREQIEDLLLPAPRPAKEQHDQEK